MNSNLNAEFNAIMQLDLDPIKVKLMHQQSGEGWLLEKANAMEFEYRRFLCLMKLFPDEQTAPFFDVDIFWHYHILDTLKYAADCEQVFGYFLHHFPYSGLRGEDDEAVHERIGTRMQQLYEATFGEAYLRQEQVDPAAIAFSQAVTAKTAFSQAVSAKTAFSQAVTAKTAFSQAVTAKTAFSQAVTVVSMWPQAVAQNDRFNPVRPVLAQAAR